MRQKGDEIVTSQEMYNFPLEAGFKKTMRKEKQIQQRRTVTAIIELIAMLP